MLIRFADCRQELPAAFHAVKVIHKPSGTELADVIAANADEQWIERYLPLDPKLREQPTERIENCPIEIRLPDDAPRCSRDVDAGVFYDADLPEAERIEAEQRVMDMGHQRDGKVQSVKEFVYQITGKNLASCFKDGEISFPIKADCEVETRLQMGINEKSGIPGATVMFSGIELRLTGSPHDVQAVVDGLDTHFANLSAMAGLNALKERQARETLNRRSTPLLDVNCNGFQTPHLNEEQALGLARLAMARGMSVEVMHEGAGFFRVTGGTALPRRPRGGVIKNDGEGGKLEAWELRRPEAREIIRMVQMSKWDDCAHNDPDLLKAIRAEYQANPERARWDAVPGDRPEAILPLAKNFMFERVDHDPSDYCYGLGTSINNY